MSYAAHAAKTTSEKLTVAWLEPSQRLVADWAIYSGSIYVRPVDHWVVGVLIDGTPLTSVSSVGAIDLGNFFFDDTTKQLYLRLPDGTSPRVAHTEVVYRLFFSNGPIDLPYDLESGRDVPYLPYLDSASSGGSSFDPNNPQIPIEGSGKLSLLNDGFFASIFDRLTWQTKRAAAYSVSRSGDKQKLYEGLVTSKAYNGNTVSFGLKDSLFRLRSQIDLPLFTTDDGELSDSLLGSPKRRIYGRVAGLKAEPIDQQLDGYLVVDLSSDERTSTPLTFSVTTASDIATASNVDAKDELCVGDGITLDAVDFKIKTLSRREFGLQGEKDVTFSQPVSTSQLRIAFTGIDLSRLVAGQHLAVSRLRNGSATLNSALFGVSPIATVGASYIDVTLDTAFSVGTVVVKVSADEMCIVIPASDTSIQLSEASTATKTDLTARVKPIIPYRRLNRSLFVSHHALHEVTETIVKTKRGNLFELTSVSGLTVGDVVVLDGTKVNTITAIDPVGTTITTATAVNPLPQAGEQVVRVAVQDVKFNNRSLTPLRDYSVSNLTGGATCSLSTTAERDSFPDEAIGTVTWQNGSKVVVAAGTLFATFHNRDWIRPSVESDWYEIEELFGESIAVLKAPYSGTSGAKATTANKPTYIGDKSNVLVNTYGLTFDGTPSGQLVRTASDAVKHLLLEAGVDATSEESFTVAAQRAPYLVSYCVPLKARGKAPTYRELINDFNTSILGVTFISNEFELMYSPLGARRSADSATYLTEFDVLDATQKADSSTIYRRIIANYRPQDLDPVTEEPTSLVTDIVSKYVDNAGIEGQAYNVDLYLYETLAAQTIAARLLFFNELPKTQIQIKGSLNLTQLFLTDLVLFRSDRLYSRYGTTDQAVIGIVTASNKSGDGATITISDLGNIYSRASVIAPNSTPNFTASSQDQKRFAGYITDEAGVVEDDNDVGTNLIS